MISYKKITLEATGELMCWVATCKDIVVRGKTYIEVRSEILKKLNVEVDELGFTKVIEYFEGVL